VSDRFEQLELRRRQLLVRSARLRADLAADQQVILDALGGVDRVLGRVRSIISFASPLLLAGGGALLLRLLRGSGRAARPARAAGVAGMVARGATWLSRARRLLTVLSIIRAVARSRSRRHAQPQP
jgi:hypothetical protein